MRQHNEPVPRRLWERLRGGPGDLLPRPGTERRLLLIGLVDAVGSGLYLGGSALFFTRVVGLSPRQIGIGLAAGAAAGLCAVFPLGLLTDKVGQRKVLVALNAWRAAGFAAYIVVRSFPAFLLVACLLGLAGTAAAPVTQALVGAAVSLDRRVQIMAWLRAVRNLGFTLGSLIVIAPVLINTRAAYDVIMLGDAASFVAAGWMAARLPAGHGGFPHVLLREHAAAALTDWRYLGVAILNGVLMLQLTMLTVAIPLWLLHDTTAPRVLIGPLLAVNTVLVVLLQVAFGRKASSVEVAGRQMAWGGLAFAACCVLVALSATTRATALAAVVLVSAVVLQTLGEVQQSAGGWRLSFDLAPTRLRGAYLGLFGLGTPLQGAIGPLVFTALVIPAGPVGWVAVAVVFALAGLLVPWLLRVPAGLRRPGRRQSSKVRTR